MMTKLREYSKVFIVIVAVAFIGLMVFDWGMDYLGGRQRSNVVGKVNGKNFTYEMFSEQFQQMYQAERQRRSDQEIQEEQMETIRAQVWEQFVQRVLFEEEMEKLKITVTDSEIVYQIRNFPMQEIKTNPGFQTNGEFDWNKYYASFSNPEMPWYQIEEFYRQQLPFEKLQNIITSTVRVSEVEIEQDFTENNLQANVAYLEIPFNKFRTADFEVSDEALMKYYTEHREEYEQEETRKLEYVSFALTPTKSDTGRVMHEFEEIRVRLAAGEDFNKLADEYSEDPGKVTNHGRYDFFERGAMVKPFEEASFNGQVGELVGPVESQYGLHLIKIEDKRKQDGKEQVKVSHILLKVTTSPSTREQVENIAALFLDEAREEGFEAAAQRNKYTIQQTGNITQTSKFIPGFGRNYQIYNFAFKNAVGAISDLVYDEQNITVFRLTDIRAQGIRPLEEVKSLVTASIRLEHQKQRARELSDKIQAEIDRHLSFSQITLRDTSRIVRFDTSGTISMKSSIPGIGYDQKFNAMAFALSPGQISPKIETSRGIYWQLLLSKSGFDSTRFASQKESIRQRLLTQKRNLAFSNWYDFLKAKADIEDNRNLFNL
jgi:parvulin-like peptidyl-prolyl isomerase